MTHASRVFIATLSSMVLLLVGILAFTNVASGSTPASFDSGTASCRTDSLGYCNGPRLAFRPNAVTITVQAPFSGPSQVVAQLTTTSFRARFFRPTGAAAAAVTVTYSYIATRAATVPPVTTSTPATTTTTTTVPPASSGTVIADAYITGYGWPDNSPPGTAISNPILHQGAGGIGTYADPITIAVGYVGAVRDYPPGTRFYIPNVRRYFIAEDTCAACHSTPAGASTWVDMWVGGNGTNDAGVLACENALTGKHTLIMNPDPNRLVVSGPLFNGTTGTCAVQYGG
jgi:hypothetical protein